MALRGERNTVESHEKRRVISIEKVVTLAYLNVYIRVYYRHALPSTLRRVFHYVSTARDAIATPRLHRECFDLRIVLY